MIEEAKNTMMKSKDVKKKTLSDEAYFFPEHGVTITAPSREEAEKQLKVMLSTKEK